MTLTWKTTSIGASQITHWYRLDPLRILDALETPALRRVGDEPVVGILL